MHRYTNRPQWQRIPTHRRFLDLASLVFLFLHLFYVQLYDRYVLIFLPLCLIAIGRYTKEWLNRRWVLTTLFCIAVVSASALWTRGSMSHSEAMWKGSEYLRRQNIAPIEIFGSWTWNAYFTFQNYLTDIGHRKQPSLDDFFLRWLPQKQKTARYLVTDTPPPKNRWKQITIISYRNSFFRPKKIFVLERTK